MSPEMTLGISATEPTSAHHIVLGAAKSVKEPKTDLRDLQQVLVLVADLHRFFESRPMLSRKTRQ